MRFRRLVAAPLAAVAISLAACGGGEEDGPPENPTANPEVLGACLEYRDAVAAVRFDATPEDQAADFEAASEAAGTARDATSEDDLTEGGEDYIGRMDDLSDAYADAAEALSADDQEAFSQVLDFAEPADDEVNGIAARGGLGDCALPVPEDGEQGVSQSGFPAFVLPEDAVPQPPDEGFAAYELSDDQAILVERGPVVETGVVPLEEAASRFDDEVAEMRGAEPVGDAGPELVPMREYTFDDGSAQGRLFVFSGQGYLWILQCANRSGADPVDEAVCDRAVESAGFLMF